MSKLPLEGIRVVSLEQAIALPFATRQLADLGAEVIRVESHRRTRPREPQTNDVVRQKAAITLDLTKPQAVKVFKELVEHTDVVCENFTPRVMRGFGLAYEDLCQIKSEIIMLSLCGYGQTGPWRNYPVYGPGIESSAGIAQLTGFPDRGPTRPGTITYADNIAGLYAAFAVMVALRDRARTGKGQYIDLAMYETNICHIGEALISYELTGQVPPRQGNRHPSMAPHGVYQCEGVDEWIAIAVDSETAWKHLCAAAAHPEWVADERFGDLASRQRHHDELDELISTWTRANAHRDIAERLQGVGVIASPVLSPKEILLDPHLQARGLFPLIRHAKPFAGVAAHPHTGPLWKLSNTLPAPLAEAHEVGQDSERIFRGLVGISDERWQELLDSGAVGWPVPGAVVFRKGEQPPPAVLLERGSISAYNPDFADILNLPRAGESPAVKAAATGAHFHQERQAEVKMPDRPLRVIDLTHRIAGPYCTKLLVQAGADVIKIEQPGGDPARRLGPFPGGEPDPEASATFLYLNTGKRSVVVDLKRDGGRRLVLDLVRRADVVVENFAPGVMSSLGLDYDTLSAVSPGLVMTSISNFGQEGPYRDYRADELTLQAFGGFLYITGEWDRPPTQLAVYQAQHTGGVIAAMATQAAVFGQHHTRIGQHIDVSLMDAVAGLVYSALNKYAYEGLVEKRALKNDGIIRIAPCKDGYIYIAPGAAYNADFASYSKFLGIPELAEPRFATYEDRIRNNEAMRGLILPKLMERGRHEWFHLATRARQTFSLVQTVDELLACPHLAERGFYQTVDHPRAGQLSYPRYSYQTTAEQQPLTPAPLLGQHNEEVLGELLGYSRADLARLREEQII